MAVKVSLLPDKINHNLNPDRENKNRMFPYYLLIMVPNIIGAFARAFRTNDYSMAVFNLLVFSVFALVDYCLPRYLSMPKHEKSSRKFLLKLTMWFLYVIISFGYVYLFSYFFTLRITVALYAVVSVSCVVLLYAFIIPDVVSGWKIWRSEECRSLDAGKSNHAYLVVEKV
ncbi:hypothetical protein SSX86_032826 [Deinandra increscens subsp. villosa]|uniref:Uncharacterized protein n=1 Tax=Deinandra increscens subsp. villosa TaxID=3103831 RepID=A0AAP0GGJ8_9ASTR